MIVEIKQYHDFPTLTDLLVTLPDEQAALILQGMLNLVQPDHEEDDLCRPNC